MQGELGRLTSVEIRDYWKNEAQDFTPWLAKPENIALLAKALGVELEVVSVERAVGPFSADILCQGSDGRYVLVENQLEKTDHTHLGQLLTYAAGIETGVNVWIAQRFTEEHRAALDWLNTFKRATGEATGDSVHFFGIEIELWRIGDSPPAPRFNVISRPHEWRPTDIVTAASMRPMQQLQLEYWDAFRSYLQAQGGPIQTGKPQPRHYIELPIGKAGVNLSAVATEWDENGHKTEGLNRVELMLKAPNAKSYYEQLQTDRAAITAELGEELAWNNPDKAQMCRLFVCRAANISDRSDWQNQFSWLQERLERFQKVFRARVGALEPGFQPMDGQGYG